MKREKHKVTVTAGCLRGLTVVEMTVVILLLLLLTSTLFIGGRAWKRSADRTTNILNICNTQKAMRSHENLRYDQLDNTFNVNTLELYMPMPSPPNDQITYSPGERITSVGELWLKTNQVGNVGGEYGPTSGTTDSW